jgi:hypothetical protein
MVKTVVSKEAWNPRILKCTCNHQYQDDIYGEKMRIFNRGVTNSSDKLFRCTVCSKEIIIRNDVTK